MNSIILLAALLTLQPGYNNPGVAGEVVAIEAATTNATATIAIKSVQRITAYTNATAQVVTYEPAWRVTVTNFNGGTSWALNSDAFPVVYGYKGQTYTIADNSRLSFQQFDDAIAVYTQPALADGYLFYAEIDFSTNEAIYGGVDAYIDSITFNGQIGNPGTWPALSQTETPYTYVTNVVGYLDYSAFVDTNGVSTIVGEPVRFDMAITNTVIVQTVPAATYAKTNDLATVTTSAHFGNVTTNAFLFGDGILVTGAAEGDSIKVLIR